MIFGEILQKLRKERNLTLKALSLLSGLSGSYISNIENGHKQNISHTNVKKLADALNTTTQYLCDEKPYNTTDNFARLQKFAPMIGWEQVENWLSEGVRMENPPSLDDYIPIASTSTEACFMLEIKNDKMECFGKDSISKGEWVIVEPASDAQNGDLVICKLSPDYEPILRQIVKEGNRITLVPLNNRYSKEEIIDYKNFKILGVVIEKRHIFKKSKKP